MLKNLKMMILLTLSCFLFTSCNLNIDSETLDNKTQMENMYKYENWDVVALMKTTNGTINILLETEKAPVTTSNFIGLAKDGYYDGIIFHRIISWFMIQWGDPTWTGMWGESIYGEKFDDEFDPELKNYKYTISMANAWANTNGSQFFINVADNNYLDNKHSVFWEVVDGLQNVDKISKVKTDSSDRPVKEVKIISLEIKVYDNWVFKDYEFDKQEAINSYKEAKESALEEKKSKVIAEWDTVKVHYTGTFPDWEKFDSSYDRGQAIEFTVWAKQMISWFDKAVVGMKIGDKKSITLEPREAYGEIDPENKQVIQKSDLYDFEKNGFALEVGTVLPTQMWNFTIIEADEITVTIDTNHQMAWKTLNFDIEIIDIN